MKLLTLFVSIISMMQLSAETVHLVKDGKFTKNAYKKGGGWKEAGAHVEGSGTGRLLSTKNKIVSKDFSISAEMKIEKFNHTAAGVYIGSSFFGLDGPKGYFTEGDGYKGASRPAKRELTSDKYFTFKAARRNGTLTVYINGKEVHSYDSDNEEITKIAIRPHRAKVAIKSFTVTADFKELEKLNFLFACGNEGYKSYRIPALATSKKGTLLAFCEGRKHHSHDHGDIDIVLKRSTDNGKTWQPLQVVFDNGNVVAGNPVPIVDQKTGRIFLVSCTSAHHEYSIYQGKGRRGIFIQHSDDDGKTWTKPRDIAANIYPQNWRWYATGPCSGIQIQEGKYAGRLVVPANHTIVEEEGTNKNVFRAHSIYSDDNGKTWKLGSSSAMGGNESSLAEVDKNTLFQSIRMQSHRKGARGTRYSKDGGVTWTELKHDHNLPCPMCQGSVIRDYSKPGRLIHANPGTGKGRTGMTVRISEDGGKSWPYSKLILPTSSAYSDLSLTKDGNIALLFEGGHFAYAKEGIIFNLIKPNSVKKN